MLPHTRKPQNGGTATNFGQFLIFGQFLPRNNVLSVKQRQFLCCTETNLCVVQRQKGGGLRVPAGGGRAVAPTQTPLVSTHPPKIAIPLLGGTIGSSSYTAEGTN